MGKEKEGKTEAEVDRQLETLGREGNIVGD